MSLTALVVIVSMVFGFPAIIGIISMICDRVTYGNWIWEVKKNG